MAVERLSRDGESDADTSYHQIHTTQSVGIPSRVLLSKTIWVLWIRLCVPNQGYVTESRAIAYMIYVFGIVPSPPFYT